MHGRMGPGQREPIQVLAYLPNRLPPSTHGVAILAAGAELIAVDVRMAVRAGDSDIPELQAPVTVHALHTVVKPL
jgi:hypothetical protein